DRFAVAVLGPGAILEPAESTRELVARQPIYTFRREDRPNVRQQGSSDAFLVIACGGQFDCGPARALRPGTSGNIGNSKERRPCIGGPIVKLRRSFGSRLA